MVSDSKIAAMNRRLDFLFKKINVHPAPGDPSMNLKTRLLDRLRTKRCFEDAFASAESISKLAQTMQLSGVESDMLLKMQATKDIAPHKPILDFILTFFFVLVTGMTLWGLQQRGYIPIFLVILVITDACIFRVKQLSEMFGAWLSKALVRYGFTDVEPMTGTIQLKKWTEQSWQLVMHIVFSVVEIYILFFHRPEWWDNTDTVWIPHPRRQWDLESPIVHSIYLIQMAVWIYTCTQHRFFDERRKDYFVMFIHHIATIALVGLSWFMGYHRGGLLVLLVHDVSDIFVDLLKLVNYTKLEGARGFFASEISYCACVLAWIYWRLYQFPLHVIYRMALRSPHKVLELDNNQTFEFTNPFTGATFTQALVKDAPGYYFGTCLLLLLLALHVYWFHLFLMIGYRILTESVRDASRQEYEGDSEDEDAEDAPIRKSKHFLHN